MNDEELLCIMAAIIYAGADDSEKGSGYTTAGAVVKAATIVGCVRNRDQILIGAACADYKRAAPK